jgi:general secretion pathway protein J
MISARRHGSAGFTLIEMMIGLVLLSIMLTVLFSSLRLGATSWDTAERKLARVAEREAALRIIERQLQLSMPILHAPDGELAKLAFLGEADRLTWVSPLPAHRGGGVQRMTLAEGQSARGSGLVLSYRLFHPDSLSEPDEQAQESVLLLEGVTGLRVTYLGEGPEDPDSPEWYEQWDDAERLPQLIRLEIETAARGDEDLTLVVEPKQRKSDSDVDFGPFR